MWGNYINMINIVINPNKIIITTIVMLSMMIMKKIKIVNTYNNINILKITNQLYKNVINTFS